MPLITSLSSKQQGDKDHPEDVAWIDLDVTNPDDQEWLESQSNLQQETIQLLARTAPSNRRETLPDGLFVSVYGINANQSTDRHEFVSLRLLLEPRRIITAHTEPVRGVQEFLQEIGSGNGPENPADFLATLALRIARRMEGIIAEISEKTDALEDRVLEDQHDPPLEEMNALRRRVFHVRRHLANLKSLLDFIASDPSRYTDPSDIEALHGASSHVALYLETIEDTRQRTQLIFDQVQSQLSETMSRATYNLTIIATVFLPLGFLTGLLGINVAGIPEEHNPWGFWVVCSVLVAVAILAVGVLRWKRWI